MAVTARSNPVRLAASVVATVLVWLSIVLQLEFVQTPRDGLCGMGTFVFLAGASVLWGVTLATAIFDGIQMSRGRLAPPMLWLRTLPAATAVFVTPATLLSRASVRVL